MVTLRNTGAVEVWVAWGQSEMRGVVTTGLAAVGGDRAARPNVLVYGRGIAGGVPDGWYAAAPEDPEWCFRSSIEPIGSPFYLAAAARAAEIEGTVCVIPYALGGRKSGEFLQGESMWGGLQLSWNAALTTPLPGRDGGQTLENLGKTLADVMLIWQGSSDADHNFGNPYVATSGDDWVFKWRTILNSLVSPIAPDSPIVALNRTKIIFFEMLHGATSGGNPTDGRNADLHKFLLYTSRLRKQIRIVPMAGVNNATTDPEVIGSFDNLHLNGAAYNEVSRRLTTVLSAFDPTAPADDVVTQDGCYTICRPDGSFTAWSKVLTAPSAAVATGSLYRSSYVAWTFLMPVGYECASPPIVSPAQCSAFPAQVCIHTVSDTVANAYIMSPVSHGSIISFRLRADGFWKKV